MAAAGIPEPASWVALEWRILSAGRVLVDSPRVDIDGAFVALRERDHHRLTKLLGFEVDDPSPDGAGHAKLLGPLVNVDFVGQEAVIEILAGGHRRAELTNAGGLHSRLPAAIKNEQPV